MLKIGVVYQRLHRTAHMLSATRSSKILTWYLKKIEQELVKRGDLLGKEVEGYRDLVGNYSYDLVESYEGEQGESGDDGDEESEST